MGVVWDATLTLHLVWLISPICSLKDRFGVNWRGCMGGHFLSYLRECQYNFVREISKEMSSLSSLQWCTCGSLQCFWVIFSIVWQFFGVSTIWRELTSYFALLWKLRTNVKFFFSFWSWYSKVIGAIRNVFEAFLYCLCAFLHFFAINIIFSHYPVVTKGRKVLFWYSSQYSKVIGESWKKN